VKAIASRALNAYGRHRLRGAVALSIGKRSKVRFDRINPMPQCRLTIGKDCIIGTRVSFDREGAAFTCGDRCYIGASHLVLAQAITLGDDVVISWGVTIVDHNSHAIEWNKRANDVLDWARGTKNWTDVKVAPVRIENRAWIGFNAIILKGITIGEGAIVGAGAVVTKDVPPYTVVAGNPARVVRALTETEA
jgi:galactoside O-acetyltransferase